jgi:hypothetical protein
MNIQLNFITRKSAENSGPLYQSRMIEERRGTLGGEEWTRKPPY